MADNNTLHLYAQLRNHSDAFIVGDRAALMALKNALEQLLSGDENAVGINTFTDDGEGYKLIVIETKELRDAQLPYIDTEEPWEGKYPRELISDAEYGRIHMK